MSKFSKYQFYYGKDPVLVHRIVYIKKERTLLSLFDPPWREERELVRTLFIESKPDFMKPTTKRLIIIREHEILPDGVTLLSAKTYDPELPRDMMQLRESMYTWFGVSLVSGAPIIIEEYLRGLPISKRLTYTEREA